LSVIVITQNCLNDKGSCFLFELVNPYTVGC